jgi:hypothetical protein
MGLLPPLRCATGRTENSNADSGFVGAVLRAMAFVAQEHVGIAGCQLVLFALDYCCEGTTDNVTYLFVVVAVSWKGFAGFDAPVFHRHVLACREVGEMYAIGDLLRLSLWFGNSVHALVTTTTIADSI